MELEFWSSNFPKLSFGMVCHSYSHSYGPDHSKTEPLEIWTKWVPFYSKLNAIGKPDTNRKQNIGLPLENGACSVFQPPLFFFFFFFSLKVIIQQNGFVSLFSTILKKLFLLNKTAVLSVLQKTGFAGILWTFRLCDFQQVKGQFYSISPCL